MNPQLPQLALEFVAHAHIELDAPLELGRVLTGQRRVIGIAGGRFEGPLLNATILSGGADWQIVTDDGTAIIDTRYSARTADGDVLFIATQGFRFGPPEVLARLAAGEAVDPAEYSFRVTVRVECGAPVLDWVNRTIFVATAARQAAAVTYDLYRVV
jgi:hypothetical protein